MTCRPYWLWRIGMKRGETVLSEQQARAIFTRYHELAAATTCSEPMDKIRALCPLLANMPVESHDELLDLLREIASQEPSSPAELPRLEGSLATSFGHMKSYSYRGMKSFILRSSTMLNNLTSDDIEPYKEMPEDL